MEFSENELKSPVWSLCLLESSRNHLRGNQKGGKWIGINSDKMALKDQFSIRAGNFPATSARELRLASIQSSFSPLIEECRRA